MSDPRDAEFVMTNFGPLPKRLVNAIYRQDSASSDLLVKETAPPLVADSVKEREEELVAKIQDSLSRLEKRLDALEAVSKAKRKISNALALAEELGMEAAPPMRKAALADDAANGGTAFLH